jgi:hypothetical protein
MSISYLLDQLHRVLVANGLRGNENDYMQKLMADERSSREWKINTFARYTWRMSGNRDVPQEAQELIVQIREQLDLQPARLWRQFF